VLSLLEASFTVAGEDFTCIKIKQKRVTTPELSPELCGALCEKKDTCDGYRFRRFPKNTSKKPKCYTFDHGDSIDSPVDGETNYSEMCMKSAKIPEMVSKDDSDFQCDRRAKLKRRKNTKVKCETYCRLKDNCDGYIYDSNDESCRALQPNNKVLKVGATKKEDVCLVISKFEDAFCRCFNKNDLDKTVDIMNTDTEVTATTNTCLCDSIYGLNLNYKPIDATYYQPEGYGTHGSPSSSQYSCSRGDARFSLEDEEEFNHCTTLIHNACTKLIKDPCLITSE